MAIHGKFYSTTYTTGSEVAEDLVSKIEDDLGLSDLKLKKVKLASSGSFAVDVNGLGVYSTPNDLSGSFCLNLDAGDVLVHSLLIEETSTIHVETIF